MKLNLFAPVLSAVGVLAVLSLTASSFMLVFLQKNSEMFSDETLLSMILFFSVTCFTMAFALTPTTFIAILTGHFFSWTGLGFMIVSYLIAAIISLATFKKFNTRLYKYIHKENQKFAAFARGLEDREFLLIFLLRLSPVFPFAIINLLLSTLDIRWKDYLVASFLGMLPRTIIFFLAGKNAVNIWQYLKSPSLEGFYKLVPVILIIISIAGIIYIIRKSLKSGNA